MQYHEAVNKVTAYVISAPFGGVDTPRSCMLTTVAAVLHNTPSRSWDMNKEMEGWEMEVDLNSCPLLTMTSMKILMNDVHKDGCGSRGVFSLRGDASSFSFVLLFLVQKGGCVVSEENKCDTEEKHDGQAKEGVVITNPY